MADCRPSRARLTITDAHVPALMGPLGACIAPTTKDQWRVHESRVAFCTAAAKRHITALEIATNALIISTQYQGVLTAWSGRNLAAPEISGAF